jgi:hypothetical protein
VIITTNYTYKGNFKRQVEWNIPNKERNKLKERTKAKPMQIQLSTPWRYRLEPL